MIGCLPIGPATQPGTSLGIKAVTLWCAQANTLATEPSQGTTGIEQEWCGGNCTVLTQCTSALHPLPVSAAILFPGPPPSPLW